MKFVCSVLLAALVVASPMRGRADAPSSIDNVLLRSAAAWNSGHLDTFMQTYEKGPETVYVSTEMVIHGYPAIRAHYAEHYGKSGMGVLSISDLSVRSLGDDYAVAVLRWHLAMTNGAHPTGLSSLVFHRGPAGWQIISDHSP